jgi:Viral BACON domain
MYSRTLQSRVTSTLRPFQKITASVLFTTIFLASCGGGGGDSGGASSLVDGAAVSPAVTFTPGALKSNIQNGTSTTISVQAVASDPTAFSSTVYVLVVDNQKLLLPNVQISVVDNRTVTATLYSSPLVAVGNYTGTFLIKLCRDPACNVELKGSPVALPYDFNVAAAPLLATAQSSTSFTVNRGGSVTDKANVVVSGGANGFTVTSSVPWINTVKADPPNDRNFTISVNPANLAEGVFQGEAIVRSGDNQIVRVPVSLNVLPTQFALTSGLPVFSAINGAPIAPQNLTFVLDNGVSTNWSVSTLATWLQISPTSGTTPATAVFQPNPAQGNLASGRYQAEVVLSTSGVPNKSITTELNLLKANLSAASTTLTIGGPKGRDVTPIQGLISLNTGTNAWPFSLSELPTWLSSDTKNGSVAQSGTQLRFTPVVTSIGAGSSSATVTATARVNGDTVSLPLTLNLNLDQRRLLPSRWGIGLAKTPTGTVLSRTVSIADNFGENLSWQASSNVSWLTVTPTGTTSGGSTLTLTADPIALSDASLHLASVTITTTTAGVQAGVIQVALWKDSTGLVSAVTLPDQQRELVADTIRPYFYAHNGGTSIDVYNGYSKQKIATISGIGFELGQMAVSLDGATLYVLDTAQRSVVLIDLATRSRKTSWPLDNAVSSRTGIQIARPNGVDVVLVGDGTAYANGRSVGGSNQLYSNAALIEVTADGRRVLYPGALRSIDYSAMGGGTLFMGAPLYFDVQSGGNEQDTALSPDGTRIFGASGGGVQSGGYKCGMADGLDGRFIGALPAGDAYPNNVAVTSDGRAICGISRYGTEFDFWVYTNVGALIRGHNLESNTGRLAPKSIVALPDGMVVAALIERVFNTDRGGVALVPIGAP